MPDLLGAEPAVGWWIGMGVLQQVWSGDDGERLPSMAGPCALVVSGTSVHGIVGPADSHNPAGWFAARLPDLQLSTEGTTGAVRKRPKTIMVSSAADRWNLTLTDVTRVYRDGPTPRGHSGEEGSLVEALAAGGTAAPLPAQPLAAPPPPVATAGAPRTSDRNPRLVATVVALVVALVVVVGVAAYLLGHNGSTAQATDGATASPTATQVAGLPPVTSGIHPPVDAAGLLAALPPDLGNCQAHVLSSTPAVATVTCGSSASLPGIAQAIFYLYGSKAAMDDQLRQWIDFDHLPLGSCATTPEGAHSAWVEKGSTPTGQVGCTAARGQASVFWSDDRYLILGDVSESGNSTADMQAVATWWAANHEYRPGS